jgi:muramoyltetrapeptide carboxypeptidase LdcA involved in peptidoglycan recycling
MITPPYLQKGDTVAILATARKHIVKSMQPTISLLESWGLHVVIGKSIGLEKNQLAGNDKERAADLQEQLDNPNIKAIWCARGGYGTVRVIDLIDFTPFKKNPKWVVGFSDVTVLHNHLNTMGYKSIHGIMPINLSKATRDRLKKSAARHSLSIEEHLNFLEDLHDDVVVLIHESDVGVLGEFEHAARKLRGDELRAPLPDPRHTTHHVGRDRLVPMHHRGLRIEHSSARLEHHRRFGSAG